MLEEAHRWLHLLYPPTVTLSLALLLFLSLFALQTKLILYDSRNHPNFDCQNSYFNTLKSVSQPFLFYNRSSTPLLNYILNIQVPYSNPIQQLSHYTILISSSWASTSSITTATLSQRTSIALQWTVLKTSYLADFVARSF